MSKAAFKMVGTLVRLLLGLAALTASLVVIIPVAAYFFLDPNDFRPQITAFITEKTELPLEIHGNIKLKLFPWVGLKVQNIDLLSGKNQVDRFIQIEEMDFQMPIKEALRTNFQIESLLLKGMSVHLIKNKNGTANWDHLSQRINKKNPAGSDNASPEISRDTSGTKRKLKFAVLQFNIENATLFYHDQNANRTLILDKLNVQGKHDQNHRYPIKGKADLLLQEKGTPPLLKGHGQFSGEATLAAHTLLAHLETQFSLQSSHLKGETLQLSSLLDINPSKEISLKNLDLKSKTFHATGNCLIPVAPQSPIMFNLTLDHLNLDKLNMASHPSETTLAQSPPSIVKTQATQHASARKTSPAGRGLKGNLKIHRLITQHLTLSNVNTQVKKEGDILKLTGLTADLYKGRLNAQVTKDLSDRTPLFFQGKIDHVDTKSLLMDLKGIDRVSGTGSATFNLSHQSRQGFNGTTQFNLKEGVISGVDINYYLNSAQHLLKKETPSVPNTKHTPFDHLSGTLNINNNIVYNPDFQAFSKTFKASGEGSVNLSTQGVAYKLQAWRQYNDNEEHPNAYPLALRIKGTLQHLIVVPDFELYLKTMVKRELKKQVDKQLERQLGKLLGKESTSENTTDEAAANTEGENVSPKDKLQEKIEKEIGKGLKKILKF